MHGIWRERTIFKFFSKMIILLSPNRIAVQSGDSSILFPCITNSHKGKIREGKTCNKL